MWVPSLGEEDPLEKEMAAHSSTLAWKILWTVEHYRLHIVHGVAKSRTRLSDFTSLLHFISSTILAWEIPWTEEPGGLQSMGSQRVRYD